MPVPLSFRPSAPYPPPPRIEPLKVVEPPVRLTVKTDANAGKLLITDPPPPMPSDSEATV